MSTLLIANYITYLLYDCGYPKNFCKMITDKKYIHYFETAFKHNSYDSKDNYEYLEIIGDKIINSVIPIYVINNFPKLKNVNLLNKINAKLKSESVMVEIGEKINLLQFIKYGQNIKDTIFLKNMTYSKEFKKLNEDVLESFIGALWLAINELQKNEYQNKYKNTNYEINANYAASLYIIEPFILYLYSYHKLSKDLNDYIDPLSEMKELIDKFEGWNTFYNENGGMIKFKNINGEHICTISLFLNGNKIPKTKNLVEVATFSSLISKEDAKIQASKLAIPILKSYL